MRYLILMLSITFALPGLAQTEKLTLGIFPYVSPVKLVRHHAAFVEYLNTTSKNQIEFVSAPDFPSFIERTKQKQYDLIITAPHLGRQAERDFAYQRIAMTRHNVKGMFVVRKQSDIHQLTDLQDRDIILAAPKSILYKLSIEALKAAGLEDKKSINIMHTKTHNNAVHAVLNGDVSAAVTGVKLLKTLKPEDRARLRVIAETQGVPGFMFMANPSLTQDRLKAIQEAALAFRHTSAGQAHLFGGYQPITDEVMKRLDPFIE